MTRWLLTLLLLTLSLPTLAAPNGAELYEKHCSVCHNEAGIGGIGLPLNGAKLQGFPRNYLFKTIRLGRPGRVMPAFERLSDAQINAIVNHILSWEGMTQEPPVYVSDTIQANAANGALLYLEHCAKCHGEDGYSGGKGTGKTLSRERHFQVVPPALNNPGFLASASDAWIEATLLKGRPDTIMPSAAELKLSTSQVRDVVAYVRSFEQQTPPFHASLDETEPALIFDSDYDFDTTVSNVKQALQGRNFRYFPDRWLEEGLTEDLHTNKKQKTLRFCNFNNLYQMLNIDPRIGTILPCRIAVIENAEGQVQLIAMNMALAARVFNNTQLESFAAMMQQTIIEVIEEATL